jgi:hypothetical protein
MIVAMIEGATRIVGKQQGFIGLPIRDELCDEKNLGKVHTMLTAWTPTPAELEALNAGANVHIRLFCMNMHPPIMVSVGPLPGVLVFKEGTPA